MTYNLKSHAAAFAAGVLVMFFWPVNNAELEREKAKLQQIEAQYKAEKEEYVKKLKQFNEQIAVLEQKKIRAENHADELEQKADTWQAIAERNEMKAKRAETVEQKLADTEQALDARTNEAETLRAALSSEREAVTWLTRISLRQAEQIEAQHEQIMRMERTIETYQQSNSELIRLCEKQKKPNTLVKSIICAAAGIAIGVAL